MRGCNYVRTDNLDLSRLICHVLDTASDSFDLLRIFVYAIFGVDRVSFAYFILCFGWLSVYLRIKCFELINKSVGDEFFPAFPDCLVLFAQLHINLTANVCQAFEEINLGDWGVDVLFNDRLLVLYKQNAVCR